MSQERAVLAGGCFWGMQELIRRRAGVIATRVGYSGGNTPNATYRHHGTHAEAMEILFDPAKISFGICWSSSFRSTIRPHAIVRAMMSDRAIDPPFSTPARSRSASPRTPLRTWKRRASGRARS